MILAVMACSLAASSFGATAPVGPPLAKELTYPAPFFALESEKLVGYGVPGAYTAKMLPPGAYFCNNGTFGVSAASPELRQCVELALTSDVLAQEDDQFTLTNSTAVKYGKQGAYEQKTLLAGTYTCDYNLFNDPLPRVRKDCSTVVPADGNVPQSTNRTGTGETPPPPPPPVAVVLATQRNDFTLTQTTAVKYGADGKFVQKPLLAGTYNCDDPLFGDPAPGSQKECSTVIASDGNVPQSTNRTGTGETPPPPPAMTQAEYARIASIMPTREGIEYRYGLPSTKPLVTSMLPGPRPSFSMDSVSSRSPGGTRGCALGDNAWCGTAQLGSINQDPGDYSSSIVNFSYVPAASWDTTKFRANGYYGHGSAQGIAVVNSTVSWKPEVSWTTWDGHGHNGGENDENTERMLGVKAGSNAGTIPANSRVIASARGYGRGGWVNNTLIAWDTGWLTASGSNTSHNFMKVKLPDGKTPTALAITNSGELALVTVMDVASMKGQVVVVALKDGCAYCLESNEAGWERNWGSARQAYAGFPGLGNYIGGKVLGTIDLPSDMKIPTEITATTGRSNSRDGGYDTVMALWDEPINTASQRAKYFNGNFSGAVANTGMALVVSRHEKRAVFLNLKPLMLQLRDNWVGPKTDAQWNANVANRGDGDGKFPPTFNDVPSQKPTIIKTVEFSSEVASAKMNLLAPFRATIGTVDGNLHVMDLGENYLNQSNGSAASGNPADISEKFAIQVGGNPTSIAYVKGKASQRPDGKRALWGYDKDEQFLLVNSREERKVTLLKFDLGWNSAEVYKTMQDARVLDPIAVEDTDNHGTESYLAGVADYSGQQLVNFAYGPVITWTYGRQNDTNTSEGPESPCKQSAPCGPIGKNAVEFTGGMPLPGYPFHVSGGNIN